MSDPLRDIQAHARAVITKHREVLEDAAQLVAAPGSEVVVIRKPWPVGRWGTVWSVFRRGPDWQATVYLGDRLLTIPLSAIARQPDSIDCARAHIRHSAAWIKLQAGEFLG